MKSANPHLDRRSRSRQIDDVGHAGVLGAQMRDDRMVDRESQQRRVPHRWYEQHRRGPPRARREDPPSSARSAAACDAHRWPRWCARCRYGAMPSPRVSDQRLRKSAQRRRSRASHYLTGESDEISGCADVAGDGPRKSVRPKCLAPNGQIDPAIQYACAADRGSTQSVVPP